MRRVWNKSQDQIAREWDSIAEVRSQQIRSGRDISYEHVLVPTLIQLAEDCDRSSVLDVGCGCGFLTAVLAKSARRVIGIDISATSIGLAELHCHGLENVRFVTGAIEDLQPADDGQDFSLAVANMSLMAMLRLDAVLASLARLVRPGGHLALTISHPCFWPQYWNYGKEWFCYKEEIVIEAPFHISLDASDDFLTTHVHRPLERYATELSNAGFHICRVLEPMPTQDVESQYPRPWEYPRFLAALCVRTQ